MAYDYLVVGAGFAGSVMAEQLASLTGKRVLICDKRPHIGGNAYDFYDRDGILIHKYGPQIFHTNSKDVFEYLSRFTDWRPYEHRALANVEGKLLPFPINLDTVNQLHGWSLTDEELSAYFGKVAEPKIGTRSAEDVIVSKVGRKLFEKFFKLAMRKEFGVEAAELADTASDTAGSVVTSRMSVRTNQDDRYFNDSYQVMPEQGYTNLFSRMLDHPKITVALGTDYRDLLNRFSAAQVIYTGPADAYFDYRYGKLKYRSLEFRFEHYDTERFLPAPTVYHPNEHSYTQVSEFTQITGQKHHKTCLVYQYPRSDGEPFYLVPTPQNGALYKKYQALADKIVNVHFISRLATFQNCCIGDVVGQALTLSSRLSGVSAKSYLATAARA